MSCSEGRPWSIAKNIAFRVPFSSPRQAPEAFSTANAPTRMLPTLLCMKRRLDLTYRAPASAYAGHLRSTTSALGHMPVEPKSKTARGIPDPQYTCSGRQVPSQLTTYVYRILHVALTQNPSRQHGNPCPVCGAPRLARPRTSQRIQFLYVRVLRVFLRPPERDVHYIFIYLLIGSSSRLLAR